MNRDDLTKAALAKLDSKILNEEVEHQMSVDREDDGYGLYDAVNDAYDIALDNAHRQIITAARKVLIDIGCWKHITDEELDYVETFGGKKYDFILGGKKYVWEKHL